MLIHISTLFSSFNLSEAYPFQVEKTGSGKESIIFIPGLGSSGDVWRETRAKFEKSHTCYTLTMPGFAGVKPEENPGFASWEKTIAEFIQTNKIVKPVIIGHSLGGGLALAIAADYPELIKSIVVVDALPCLSGLMNPSFKSNPDNDCSQMITQLVNIPDEQFIAMQKMTAASMVTAPEKQELMVTWSVTSDRATIAKMYCDFLNTDLREKIRNISCPSLILLEANFRNMKTNIEAQYENLKNANLQYADKGLHFIMYDDQQWYLSKLNDFISH